MRFVVKAPDGTEKLVEAVNDEVEFFPDQVGHYVVTQEGSDEPFREFDIAPLSAEPTFAVSPGGLLDALADEGEREEAEQAAYRESAGLGEHWPTLEETEAEDRAAGRIDEAMVAAYRENADQASTAVSEYGYEKAHLSGLGEFVVTLTTPDGALGGVLWVHTEIAAAAIATILNHDQAIRAEA